MKATLVGSAEFVEIEEISVCVDGVVGDVQVRAGCIWDSMEAPSFRIELGLEL